MTTDLSADEEWRTNFERGKLEAQAAMVRNMLKLGCSSELIQQVSGFDDRQMAQLQQELACEAAGFLHGRAEALKCVERNIRTKGYSLELIQQVTSLDDAELTKIRHEVAAKRKW